MSTHCLTNRSKASARVILALIAATFCDLGCDGVLGIPSHEDLAESAADGASGSSAGDSAVANEPGDGSEPDAGHADASDAARPDATDATPANATDASTTHPTDAAGPDAGDASTTDAGDATTADASDAAGPDASDATAVGADGATTYNPIESPSLWSTFDLKTAGTTGSFAGGAYDGQFVYFAPASDGKVARYDVRQAFDDTSAWSLFDTQTIDPNLERFSGAVFDGHYLYLVPLRNSHPADGYVGRYDTKQGFFNASAWTFFDVSAVNPNAVGFSGGTFDGQYVYLAPNLSPSGARNGTVVRYAIGGGFGVGSSWESFDTTTLNPPALGFTGAAFDGRYVYFVPNSSAEGVPDGVIARYDTHGDFIAASWSSFDLTTIDSGLRGFACAGFDGRYLFLVPDFNGFTPPSSYVRDGIVARYDTWASTLDDRAAWTEFDTSTLPPAGRATGFQGAAFDGRYLYLAPIYNDVNLDGLVVRYDTTAPFTDGASWSWFDTGAYGFFGAVFDGQYVYFAPYGGPAARFDAKAPPSMPTLPDFYGSFF